KTDFVELAEIIRAVYIQNHFSQYSSEDMDAVVKLTYDALERIDPNNRNQAGLLITQFFRLPLPEKRRSTYQQLEAWLELYKDPFLNRLAVSKLVLQDLRPPEKAIKQFVAGYLVPLDRVNRADWIRSTDDIRSASV